MTLYAVLFYCFSLFTAISAVTLAVSKNVFYSAVYVIVTLISLAGLYVLLFAEFVAVTQILVYAGGVLVIIIFGIMLTAKTGNKALVVSYSNVFTGLLLAIPLFVLLTLSILDFPLPSLQESPLEKHPDAIETIGINMMSESVLAFEVAGLLLLISLVGAAVIASTKPKEG